jgi:ATP synthase B/B'' CF(0).
LQTRKEIILKNMQDSFEKKQQAFDNLNNALVQFESSKIKANEIRSQGIILAKQNSDKIVKNMQERLKRLEDTKNFNIRFEEEKAIMEVVRYVILNIRLIYSSSFYNFV